MASEPRNYPDYVFVAYDEDFTAQTYDIAVSLEPGNLVGRPVKYIRHDLNTRPAPAATDTGLVTIGGINLASGEMISCQDFDDGNPLHIPCCRKDRAEELLAAKDAERAEQWRLRREMEADRDTQKAIAASFEAELSAERAENEKERLRFEADLDKWMKIIGAGITGYQPEAYALMDLACQELVKLRSDNAAKDARIKELDRCHEGTIDLCNQKTAQIKALEAKLAAAEKALEEVQTYVQSQRTQLDVTDPEYWAKYQTLKDTGTKIREARAVLGGKKS